MPENDSILTIPANEMQDHFTRILLKYGLPGKMANQCAAVFTSSSVDGVYTHGVNRFPRFIQYIKEGYVQPNAMPTLVHKFGGMEQWNGNLGPGISNAISATENAMKLAQQNGIGCIALQNTNHWMRGGTYGWQAAKAGFIFIGWTNTIANMPAWGALDAKLGNNPLVIALPYKEEAIVIDMAMTQYSFGSLELAVMKDEQLAVYGGFDEEGNFTKDPKAILASKQPMPVGFWKGAGLSLLLDLLATILSGGQSTYELSKKEIEYGMSQVFIAVDVARLGNHSEIKKTIEAVIQDYHQSIKKDNSKEIVYPGERVLQVRQRNLANGIPVFKKVWEEILHL